MCIIPLSISEAKKKNLKIITYFRGSLASDLAIGPKKNINIGTKEKPKIVDCDIRKSCRIYNHFEWIEKMANEINEDVDRKVYIIQDLKGGRALAVNIL